MDDSRSALCRLRLDAVFNFQTPSLNRSRWRRFMLAMPSPCFMDCCFDFFSFATQVLAEVCASGPETIVHSTSCCFYAESAFFRAWLEAVTSPLRNAVVVLIISSTDFGMLSCRSLISL
nr:hypothetical protein [Tanacetum cinerariifolium]